MFSFARRAKGNQVFLPYYVVLHGRKPRANTSVAFIRFVKSLCESEILEGEDGASLRRATTHVAT